MKYIYLPVITCLVCAIFMYYWMLILPRRIDDKRKVKLILTVTGVALTIICSASIVLAYLLTKIGEKKSNSPTIDKLKSEMDSGITKLGIPIPTKCEIPLGNCSVWIERIKDVPPDASHLCMDRLLKKGANFRFTSEEKTTMEFTNLPFDYASDFVEKFNKLGGEARFGENLK